MVKIIYSCALLIALSFSPSISKAYSFGMFGVPELETYKDLYSSGLDHYFIRHHEIDKISNFKSETLTNPYLIYVLGLNPKSIKNDRIGIALERYSNVENKLDFQGVYVADDLKCRYRDTILNLSKNLNKSTNLLVGDLSRKSCFNGLGFDIMTYRYPAMRYNRSLTDNFKKIITKSNVYYSNSTKNMLFTQAHYQDWYAALLNCSDLDKRCEGKNYPDGQLIRLFMYTNMLSGSYGQYIYNGPRLKGETNKEKIIAIKQTLIETHILKKYIEQKRLIKFHVGINGTYGSVINYSNHRLTSYFLDSKYASVHPSTARHAVKMINKDIYFYDKYCWRKIGGNLYTSESTPLITTNAVPKKNHLCSNFFENKKLHKTIISRVKLLEATLQTKSLNKDKKSLQEDYSQLGYLNEYKLNSWLMKKQNDYNGDKINKEYWISKKKNKLGRFRKKYRDITPYLNYYTLQQFNKLDH